MGGYNMIIAEIGINHNGDLAIAKEMIKKAKSIGVDVVKFQKRNPNLCVPEDQKNKLRITPWGLITYLEYKKKIEFSKSEYDEINKYCKEMEIKWTASVWDIDSLNFIMQYDIPFIKIPSACITDLKLINEISKYNIPVVMSTGMSTIEEIDIAEKILSNNELTIMSCTSTYPTEDNEINLSKIITLKQRYRKKVGFSSHSTSIMPTIISLFYSAEVIEVHVTLDKSMWGTDQSASLDFVELEQLVKTVKLINTWHGDGIIRCYDSENSVKTKLRKI